MKEVLNKINSILDSAISILDPSFFVYPTAAMFEGYTTQYSNEIDDQTVANSATHSNEEQIFSQIFGLENVKDILNMALRSDKSAHILLSSPPGMAKTQFLLAIRNAYKEECGFIIGSSSTKKGIIDLLFEKRPQILLIDELETMSLDTQESLLNLMETGIVSETKKTCMREMQLENIKVFATSNDTKGLLNPLLSRFIVLDIPPYTEQQFIEIAVQRLMREERITEEVAIEIVEQVLEKLNRRDLRDCVKVARIAKTPEEIASVISIMK
jgi:holliday junction DNA helicase RuvB